MISQFRTGLIGLFSLPDCPGSPIHSQNRACKTSFLCWNQWGSIFQPLETSSTNLWKPFAGKKKPKNCLAWFSQSASKVYHLFWYLKSLFTDWTALTGPCLENVLWRCSPIWKDWKAPNFLYCLPWFPYNETWGFNRHICLGVSVDFCRTDVYSP